MQGATMAARAGRAAMLLCLAAAPCAGARAKGRAPEASVSPSTDAYRQAMASMDAAMMAAPPTGDADRDFVSGMLAHQGAIDMARVERRFGRDPAMRRLARHHRRPDPRDRPHARLAVPPRPRPLTPPDRPA